MKHTDPVANENSYFVYFSLSLSVSVLLFLVFAVLLCRSSVLVYILDFHHQSAWQTSS